MSICKHEGSYLAFFPRVTFSYILNLFALLKLPAFELLVKTLFLTILVYQCCCQALLKNKIQLIKSKTSQKIRPETCWATARCQSLPVLVSQQLPPLKIRQGGKRGGKWEWWRIWGWRGLFAVFSVDLLFSRQRCSINTEALNILNINTETSYMGITL